MKKKTRRFEMKSVGLQVTRARADREMTLSELHGKTDISIERLVMIEDGDERVFIWELAKVAEVLGQAVCISFNNIGFGSLD